MGPCFRVSECCSNADVAEDKRLCGGSGRWKSSFGRLESDVDVSFCSLRGIVFNDERRNGLERKGFASIGDMSSVPVVLQLHLLDCEAVSLSDSGSIIELVTAEDSCVPVSCSAVLHVQDDDLSSSSASTKETSGDMTDKMASTACAKSSSGERRRGFRGNWNTSASVGVRHRRSS